jgi:transcriptional regulator with XRE-family HTH domain
MTLADLLKQRRQQASMSLQDVADVTGITKTHVHEIETGKTVNIGVLTAIRLSVALGVSINVVAAAALVSSELPRTP